MTPSSGEQRSGRSGLCQVFPAENAADTTIDIIAIHGLGTESPRTWVFKRGDAGEVNWLEDSNMLPAAVPEARIFTYDWKANYFEDAPVETLLGHADTFLAHVNGRRPSKRPIIFVASCFGGLVLSEALTRAAQEGSPYRQVLLLTVGIVFLATPFHGSDAHKEAGWQVVVGGIMGEDTSDRLVHDLNQRHDFVLQRVQKFAEVANADSIRLPVHCFYETKKTEILRRILSPGLAAWFSTRFTRKLLVSESSACLHGFPRLGLIATHSGMNKFDSPKNSGFLLVKQAIQGFAKNASSVLSRRSHSQRCHWTVRFDRNEGFVGRESILTQLLKRIPPSANKDSCQRTAIEGLGGVGKTQIAVEAAFRLRNEHPDCSVFWVPAVDATTFENAYREIGRKLKVEGIDEDKVDVKALVKAALSRENAGRWLLIVDNADDMDIFFGPRRLSDSLPSNRMGSILFTTRSHKAAVKLAEKNLIAIPPMDRAEALELLEKNLADKDMAGDVETTTELLDLLADLPLAIRQASAYMNENQISVGRYLEIYKSDEDEMIYLLSQEFEDGGRYDRDKNPIAATWVISFSQIRRQDPLAADYLQFMCFLAQQDIPQSLLPPDRKAKTAEAIGTLKGYAFITEREKSNSYDIHRLVQVAARYWLKGSGEWKVWATKVIGRVAEEFPFPEHENRDVWMKYLPHAQAALEFGEDCTEKVAKSRLLFNVANSFNNLGKYKEAEEMHRQTLELREKVLGKEHPSTLDSMNNLALVLSSRGKYEEAEEMHRQEWKLTEKVLGKEHPSTQRSRNNLAKCLRAKGETIKLGY